MMDTALSLPAATAQGHGSRSQIKVIVDFHSWYSELFANLSLVLQNLQPTDEHDHYKKSRQCLSDVPPGRILIYN